MVASRMHSLDTSVAEAHPRYEYGYDAKGNQTSMRDNIFQTEPADAATIDRSGMRETAFTFDWRGNQTSRTLPDGTNPGTVYIFSP